LRRVLIFILGALLLLLPQQGFSQLITHTNVVRNGYNFWIYMPDQAPADSVGLPVVLFLHGQSLCGKDLSTVRRYGPLDALKYGRKIDAIILAPQNPGGSWNPRKLMNVLEWTEGKYPIDTNRVYVFGMSLGGYGTIDFAGTYPDKVAAAIAMCGGGTIKDCSGLNKVPLWILHGKADSAVPWTQSQKVVDAMKKAGPTDLLRYDLYDGVSHGRLGRVFYMTEPYEWFFKHSLADSVRTVNKEYEITTSGMANAYKSMPGRRNLKVRSYTPSKTTSKASSAKSAATKASESKDTSATAKPDSTASSPNGVMTEIPEAEPVPEYYTIKKGDTLEKIARAHHTTVDSLCRKNGIKRTTILQIGRRLKL